MRRSKVNTCAKLGVSAFDSAPLLCSTQRTKRCLVRLQCLPKALSIGTRPMYVMPRPRAELLETKRHWCWSSDSVKIPKCLIPSHYKDARRIVTNIINIIKLLCTPF